MNVEQAGLSPRARGNLGIVVAVGLLLRSIPACAGEPVDRPKVRFQIRVYPRVRGGT